MKREGEINACAPDGLPLGNVPAFVGRKRLTVKLNALIYSEGRLGRVFKRTRAFCASS